MGALMLLLAPLLTYGCGDDRDDTPAPEVEAVGLIVGACDEGMGGCKVGGWARSTQAGARLTYTFSMGAAAPACDERATWPVEVPAGERAGTFVLPIMIQYWAAVSVRACVRLDGTDPGVAAMAVTPQRP